MVGKGYGYSSCRMQATAPPEAAIQLEALEVAGGLASPSRAGRAIAFVSRS